MPSSVAVIIPVYNVTEFLEEAIDSVRRQKYPAKEIIVVNDGSDEEPARHIAGICSKFPDVTLINQPRTGTAAARDKGVAHSKADYIYFLDGDDRLCPGALQYLARALDRNPDAIASYARYRIIDAKGKLTSEARPSGLRMKSGSEILPQLLKLKQVFINGSICIRKNRLEKVLANNHSLIYAEDWVLWCHLARVGNIIPAGRRVIHHYRRHDKSTNNAYKKNPEPAFMAYATIFKDPVFIEAVGRENLETLEKKALSRVHMKLASYYAAKGEIQKAQSHLDRVLVPPTVFMKR